MVTIFGTTFGNLFGNSFWLFFVAQVYRGGLVAAHVSAPRPCRHEKEQATHRGVPIQTQRCAYQKAWRAPLFDLTRRDAVVHFGALRSKHFSKAVAIACASERSASTRCQLKLARQFMQNHCLVLLCKTKIKVKRGKWQINTGCLRKNAL